MIQTTKQGNKPIAMRLKKKPLWAYKASPFGKDRVVNDNQITRFGESLYSKLKNGETLERERVGDLIQSVIGKDIGISSGSIGRWISLARGFFIKEYNQTIIYLPSVGAYKIAEGAEKPQRVSKLGHQTLRWKAKFLAEASILNKEDLLIAGASIVEKMRRELGGGNLDHTEILILSAKEDLKTLRIEANNAQK